VPADKVKRFEVKNDKRFMKGYIEGNRQRLLRAVSYALIMLAALRNHEHCEPGLPLCWLRIDTDTSRI